MNLKIAPSVLSADFSDLAGQIKAVEAAGADMLHLDVMDGHFVGQITFGPLVVRGVRKLTKLPLDVHLMITDPDKYLDEFIKAGANIISFHAETTPDPHKLIDRLDAAGVKASVALNPETPFAIADDVLERLDMVLLMTVHPGKGGQEYIREVTPKIAEARKAVGKGIDVEVDGGINPATAREAVGAGASVLVAGHAIFRAPDIAAAVRSLREGV